MAELRRLDSAILYGNHTPGCVWSFFHAFDSHHRRETKKMLSYRRMVVDRQYIAGTDIHIDNEGAEGDDVGDKAINIIEKQKGNNMKKVSGKAHILKFISKKWFGWRKHRGKISHSSSELMDTISNSESNCFIPQSDSGQMTTDNETSIVALNLDDTDSLPSSEHESFITSGLHGFIDGKLGALGALNTGKDNGCISHKFDGVRNYLLDEHIILNNKLFEARDALLKQKDTDPKGMTVEFFVRSKIFLDTLQLFNTNREALYNACNSQNSSLANDMQTIALDKSISLSGSEFSENSRIPFSSHKQLEDSFFVNQVPISKSVDLPDNTFGAVLKSEVLPVSCHEQRKQREPKTVLSRLRLLKQRIKGVIVENKEENHRIFMDRILHKVPSGRKLMKDEEDHKLHLRDGYFSQRYHGVGQEFKFDRMVPGSSDEKIAVNSFQRSRSLVESLDRYSHLLDSFSSNELRGAPGRSSSVREGGGLLQRKLPKTHGRMLSNPELLRSYSYSKEVQREMHLTLQSSIEETSESVAVEEIASEQVGSLDSNIIATTLKAIVSDKTSAPDVEISSTETNGHGSQSVSKGTVEEESVWFNVENPVDDSPSIKPEKQSTISVLDSNIEEELVTPLKFSALAGSEPQLLLDDDLKEQPIPEPRNCCNEPDVPELSRPDFSFKLSNTVNEKDAPEFTFVKHILSKSGYDALFSETFDASDEVSTESRLLCDMPFDEQLLYDLIQEVLLDIYEYSTAPSSWLPHFHSKIRSMPTGSYLLREVWAEIRWHLRSLQRFGTPADDVFARNFSKDDGWMNLYRDAECYGLLLEQLILDDLVDEIMLDSDSL